MLQAVCRFNPGRYLMSRNPPKRAAEAARGASAPCFRLICCLICIPKCFISILPERGGTGGGGISIKECGRFEVLNPPPPFSPPSQSTLELQTVLRASRVYQLLPPSTCFGSLWGKSHTRAGCTLWCHEEQIFLQASCWRCLHSKFATVSDVIEG